MNNFAIKIISLISLLLLCFTMTIVEPVSIYPAPKKTVVKKTTSKKSKSKSKSKSKIKKSNTSKKNIKPPSHTFIVDSLLESGISYKRVHISMNNLKHDVHILQLDLNNKKVELNVVKAGNNITELEKLPAMLPYIESDSSKTLGGINANFWRAYTNYPIGPTVIHGEVIEMPTYKRWTSTFWNEDGKPFMGSFTLQGEIITQNGFRMNLKSVNRRKDTTGLIMYNKFGGDIIPYIDRKKAEELLLKGLDNVFQDVSYDDSTEQAVNLDKYREELFEAQRASNFEYNMIKVAVKYLENPAVNAFVKCEVIAIDSGSMKQPQNGCILSFGKDIDTNLIPKTGDKLNIHFWTNTNENELFMNSVSGTPRLVRDGIAQHEAYEEGSKSRRFINGALSRTAIGYNKDKSKMFLVVVDNRKRDGTVGASLSQMADIMEYLGCYSAQNLDGGGSSNMVIKGKNMMNDGDPYTSRRLAVAVSAVSLKQPKEISKPKLKKR